MKLRNRTNEILHEDNSSSISECIQAFLKTNKKLNELELLDEKIENVIFFEVDLKKSEFSNCDFINCEFNLVDFTNAIFKKCNFKNCKIEKTNFESSKILKSSAVESSFDNSNFCKSIIREFFFDSNLVNVNFSECSLEQIEITNEKIINCNFSKILFLNSNIICSSIKSTNFSNSKLNQTNINSCSEISGCIFYKVEMETSSINSASFYGCSFDYIDKIDFIESSFESDFIDCSFIETTINSLTSGMKFKSCNFKNANFREIKEDWEEFIDCNLTGTFFQEESLKFVRANNMISPLPIKFYSNDSVYIGEDKKTAEEWIDIFKNDEKGVSFDVYEDPETYDVYDSSYFPQCHNYFLERDSIKLKQIKAVFYAKMAYYNTLNS